MIKSSVALVVLIIGSCLFTTSVKAQSKSKQPVSPMKVGAMTINAGIGIGSQYDGHGYGNAFGTKVAAEWGLWKAGPGVITLGGEVGGSFSSDNLGLGSDNYKSRTIVVAVRSAWHCGWNVKGLDTYGGLSTGLGFEHYNYSADGKKTDNKVIPVFGGFVGASYFFTPSFGVNAEAGYDITNLQAGVIFKLK